MSEILYWLQLALSLANVLMICAIVYQFLQIYKNIKSRFNFGLTLFGLVMLVQAVFSFPIIEFFQGLMLSTEFRTYMFISQVFEFIALIIFLSLVRK
ncbi:MAG: hypothetical protein HY929_04220 [Euryarchaeota archaeon]|nr:hypothetical protein [Euryarchaeota archaeon]